MPYKDKEKAKEQKRRYYLENREKLRAYAKVPENKQRSEGLHKARRQQRKRDAIVYKGGECVDCHGIFPAPCFDFHHLNPAEKDFDPCKGITRPWEIVIAELDKCVLLCANCHRVRHFT